MTKFEKIAKLIAGLSVKDLESFTPHQAEAFRVVHSACMGHDPLTHGLSSSEVMLVNAGRWVEAIKAVRNRTGKTLADAKAVVDGAREKLGA